MKKMRFYLETSVWNFLVSDEISDKQLATKRFFEEVKLKGYQIYISPLVVIEIERTKQVDVINRLRDVLLRYQPELLEELPDVLLLSEKYCKEGIIPEKYRNDAIHIAYVSLYELDAIISWNLRHIVKMKTRRLVNYINLLEGYRSIELVTPEEVIEDER